MLYTKKEMDTFGNDAGDKKLAAYLGKIGKAYQSIREINPQYQLLLKNLQCEIWRQLQTMTTASFSLGSSITQDRLQNILNCGWLTAEKLIAGKDEAEKIRFFQRTEMSMRGHMDILCNYEYHTPQFPKDLLSVTSYYIIQLAMKYLYEGARDIKAMQFKAQPEVSKIQELWNNCALLLERNLPTSRGMIQSGAERAEMVKLMKRDYRGAMGQNKKTLGMFAILDYEPEEDYFIKGLEEATRRAPSMISKQDYDTESDISDAEEEQSQGSSSFLSVGHPSDHSKGESDSRRGEVQNSSFPYAEEHPGRGVSRVRKPEETESDSEEEASVPEKRTRLHVTWEIHDGGWNPDSYEAMVEYINMNLSPALKAFAVRLQGLLVNSIALNEEVRVSWFATVRETLRGEEQNLIWAERLLTILEKCWDLLAQSNGHDYYSKYNKVLFLGVRAILQSCTRPQSQYSVQGQALTFSDKGQIALFPMRLGKEQIQDFKAYSDWGSSHGFNMFQPKVTNVD